MTFRSIAVGELRSLREELSTARAARKTKGAPTPATAERAAAADELRDEIDELVSEAAKFLEEAEKDIAAHPLAIAIGGIVVGMMIGAMFRRR